MVLLQVEVDHITNWKLLQTGLKSVGIDKEIGIDRLVSASTGGAIMGEVPPPIHEEMVPRPLSPYGASKLALEGYSHAFAASYGLKATSLRFSNVYGPLSFHKGSVVATFFRRILAEQPLVFHGDGSQTRDYVFASDLCDAILSALTCDQVGVFQLGSGHPTSLIELVETMRLVVGDKYRIDIKYENFRAGEVKHTFCDIAKAREVLGYNPDTSLPQGLTETWAWFQQNHR